MLIPTITLLPQAPQSSSPANFRTDADVFVAALNIFDDEMNEAISGINAILPSLDAASSAANFKGTWNSVTNYTADTNGNYPSVVLSGITYVAILPSINQNPSAATTYWQPTGTAPLIHSASEKGTPVDADEFALIDSAGSFELKKITLGGLKTALMSVFAEQTDYASADGTIGGTVKARISGSTLYLRTDGTNA